jgi:protoporphyrin/coproporphyrin ferrochelatase
MKTGVLLINTGSPDAPTPKAVGKYLKEFLSDPRVIDIPALWRWLLVWLIVPRRSHTSAKAYAKIWTTGSPLIAHSRAVEQKVAALLGSKYIVKIGMRYGQPSIAQALEELQTVKELIVLPLFPQYASAATGSAVEEVYKHLNQLWNIPPVKVLGAFYDNADFITAVSDNLRNAAPYDFVLFSYHGLPERHVKKSETLHCNRQLPCPSIGPQNAFCYRAQCFATTQRIAKTLQLNHYQVAFQSRLGRTPWIKPYTDKVLPELYQQGFRRLAVVCPSFVADCLETLEEVGMRLQTQWLQLGGESLKLVPCVNDHPQWIQGIVSMVLAESCDKA